MIVDPTTVTSSAATTSAANSAMKQSMGLNTNDFLNLFITQLQNQDPLNPQDSSQFIGQLAQLTQVEQAYNTNTNLQGLLSQGGNSTAMASVSMIGKQVQAQGSQVSLQSGSPTAVNFSLASAASNVTVAIKDAGGNTVKTISGGAAAAGQGSIAWDGTNTAGSQLASGVYTFSVAATDASGNAVTATPMVKGTVTGVDLTGTSPVLNLGNLSVNLTNVTSVSGV